MGTRNRLGYLPFCCGSNTRHLQAADKWKLINLIDPVNTEVKYFCGQLGAFLTFLVDWDVCLWMKYRFVVSSNNSGEMGSPCRQTGLCDKW